MNTNEWLRAISWIVMGIMMEVLADLFTINRFWQWSSLLYSWLNVWRARFFYHTSSD